jgi:membrane protein YqaA with SNARE-associated domain
MNTSNASPNFVLLRASQASFDGWQRFAEGRAGLVSMFVWAVCEATFWPIIADVLLAPMAAVNRRFHRSLLACIAGMALGGTATFLFAHWFPKAAMRTIRQMPMVREDQITRVTAVLTAQGWRGYFQQPYSGIPYKVWGVVGGDMGLAPWQAIPAFILARAFRMMLAATISRAVGARFTPQARDYWLLLVPVYVVLFLAGWRRASR